MNPQISIGQIIFCSLLVFAGLLVHFVAKLSELENSGAPIGPWEYIRKAPFTALNVVLGAYGLLLMGYLAGEMGPFGSFCMGVAANAAGDKFRASAKAKVEGQTQ